MAHAEMLQLEYAEVSAKILTTYLGVMVSRLSDFCSSLCTWNYTGGRGTKNTFSRQSLPMVWDFAETNRFNDTGANWQACVDAAVSTLSKLPKGLHPIVIRGSATSLPYDADFFDAVITDPPYYD